MVAPEPAWVWKGCVDFFDTVTVPLRCLNYLLRCVHFPCCTSHSRMCAHVCVCARGGGGGGRKGRGAYAMPHGCLRLAETIEKQVSLWCRCSYAMPSQFQYFQDYTVTVTLRRVDSFGSSNLSRCKFKRRRHDACMCGRVHLTSTLETASQLDNIPFE